MTSKLCSPGLASIAARWGPGNLAEAKALEAPTNPVDFLNPNFEPLEIEFS